MNPSNREIRLLRRKVMMLEEQLQLVQTLASLKTQEAAHLHRKWQKALANSRALIKALDEKRVKVEPRSEFDPEETFVPSSLRQVGRKTSSNRRQARKTVSRRH